MKNNLYGMNLDEISSQIKSYGLTLHHALEILKYLYHFNLEKPHSFEKVEEHFIYELPEIITAHESQDQTIKFLMKFQDNLQVETVLIPFHKRFSICLSTQVGCAMNCSFCYTGKQGLKRNLKAHEIVGQYIVARNYLKKKNQKALDPNIVFMGQGEPLHNVIEVKKATEIFLETQGLHLGPKQITLSTAGYLPNIKELHHFPPINIALSLHSPFAQERNQLIPINEKYPLEKVLYELSLIPMGKRQFINCEYLLIKDLNDSEEHANALSLLLKNYRAIVNLIPFNPIPHSSYERPEIETIEHFKKILVKNKIHTMIRTTKGDEIMAACGQLNSKKDYSSGSMKSALPL
jgi:23S rRNA (adenine2503-C2)-methyltransferase